MTATKRIWEVLYDGAGEGPAADGTFIARFSTERDALRFCQGRTCYGRPDVKPSVYEAPRKLARRWGF